MPAYLLIKKILLLSFNDNLEMFETEMYNIFSIADKDVH